MGNTGIIKNVDELQKYMQVCFMDKLNVDAFGLNLPLSPALQGEISGLHLIFKSE